MLLAGACGNDNTKLMVTGIEPDKGDVGGGTSVHIKGNRFTADGPRSVKVFFGGREGSIDHFVNDSEFVVIAPSGKLNDSVDLLVVFDPGGRITLPSAYRYIEKNQAAPTVDDLNINPDKKPKK